MIKVLLVTLVTIVCLCVIFLYLFPLVRVSGDSMYPTYKDEEVIITTRLFRRKNIKPDDIFIFQRPDMTESRFLIKRVIRVRNTDIYFLGDNRLNSYDSRNFGYVPINNLVSKVIRPRKKGN